MKVTVVGCGDAFGSGGRGSSCYVVEAGDRTIALDCGATALVDMKRRGLDPHAVDAVVLSHLHGDHFGGVPFLLLDRHYHGQRAAPLSIVGPLGTRQRLFALMDALFPDSSRIEWRYPLSILELPTGVLHAIGEVTVETAEVVHPSGAPSTAVRLSAGGRVLAFSGDTSWTEALVAISRAADLFICECFRLADAPGNHLDLATLERERPRLDARRILLTHMSAAVLDRIALLEAKGYLVAHDGLVLDLASPKSLRRRDPVRRAVG